MVAHISLGYPFRGAVESTPTGEVSVVQIKNVGVETGVDWAGATRTDLKGRRDPEWLSAGDILFSARGHRNVAVCLANPPPKAVCSPYFFLIRIREGKPVLPEFLAWQMNVPQTQRYLAQSATGSLIKSIRRDALEKLPLRIPALEQQRLLVRLSRAALREKELLQQLIESRQRELDLVAEQLLA